MANPLIALQGKSFDVNQTFSNALTNLTNAQQAPLKNRLLAAQAQQAETGARSGAEDARFRSVINAAVQVNALPLEQRLPFALNRRAQLQQQGIDTSDTDAFISAMQSGNTEGAQRLIDNTIAAGQQTGVLKPQNAGAGGLASAKTEILESGGTIQTIPTAPGQPARVVVTNPAGEEVQGQARLDALEEARQQRRARQQQAADISVGAAQGAERVKQREKRISEIQKEMSSRNRDFKRASVRLNQALNTVITADQGIKGSVKLKLSRLVPGIDVTNEAVLEQTLKQLTLDQLQSFKGPTTDFEFGQAESTVGTVGDNKTANMARVKSLSRANWFNKREFEQFKRFKRLGGDPDDFAFNFNEQVETKKGTYSLQDLQDTAVDFNMTIEEVLERLNR